MSRPEVDSTVTRTAKSGLDYITSGVILSLKRTKTKVLRRIPSSRRRPRVPAAAQPSLPKKMKAQK